MPKDPRKPPNLKGKCAESQPRSRHGKSLPLLTLHSVQSELTLNAQSLKLG